MTYEILKDWLPELEKKLNHISKKCAKYGNPFAYVVGEEFYKEIPMKNNFGVTEMVVYKFINIEVSGTAIIEDWEFVATLEHHYNGNIIKRYNLEIDIPERFKSSEEICEHCHSNRFRTYMYVIHNVKTNEWKQVGKSCLKSYTNGLSAEYVAGYIQAIQLLENMSTDHYTCEGANFGNKKYYAVEEILSYALAFTNKLRYKKSEEEDSTKNLIVSTLTNGLEWTACYYSLHTSFNEKEIFTEDTKKTVNCIIQHYLNLDDNSEFAHNVKVILSEKYCSQKNVGSLAYLPEGYRRAMEKAKESAEEVNYTYFGEIGKRYKDIAVEISLLTYYETMYGMTNIYKMVDSDGHLYIWKTTKYCELGTRIVTMTVKEHKEYRGQKQTEVTRCKVA